MFKALESRNFKIFFYGQSISVIGTWLQKTAVSWMVYSITNSVFLLGLVMFFSMIPSLFLSPLAGSFLKKYDRHRTMIVLQFMAMFQAGLMALVFYTKTYNIELIMALSLFQGIINSFDMICRQTMMVEIVDNKDNLANAVALNTSLSNFARIAGPALAGIILHRFGADVCFIGNFLSYLPVLCSLFLMRLTYQPKLNHKIEILNDFIEGLDYVKKEADMGKMLLLLVCSSLFVTSFITLLPVFAKDIFSGNAQTFSWFESSAGIGSLLSAIYLTNLKQGTDVTKITLAATLLLGSSMILLSFAPNLLVALVCTTLCGLGMMAQTSSINIYIQLKSASHMRSRSISYFIMAYQGMLPIGSLLIGILSHNIGTRLTVTLQGILCIVAAIVFLIFKNKTKEEEVTPIVHHPEKMPSK
ncbi:MFS transporter [Flavobacterium faecale]|uniref:MFS transporter n=1 Tax=Flavobacterium faecale TaxID=1355330 RepID=A0A2S1L9Z6_9FLAO|nr:MFS transporter [Flavobacterium faecale]AWG20547.1 MFS transporter [Flavobacterium faecale]